MWNADSSGKITDEHRRRTAIVYVRQSSIKQVEENLESQRRQYELPSLAHSLGFRDVTVIDEDLGRSGSGTVSRPGFDKLFKEVASGRVGAVFCLETSRLAHNGRDWHALLEVCRHLGTLIVSADGVADPRLGDDQLVLGLKGTLAEYELSLLRQRGLEARRQKAERGDFQMPLPVGFAWGPSGRIEKTPDLRVQRMLEQVFAKFWELGSALKVTQWCVEEKVELPVVQRRRGRIREICWSPATRSRVLSILKNPINAGAYAYGRSTTQTEMVDGRLRKHSTGMRPLGEWDVLIEENHEGYVSWSDYLRLREKLAANNYQWSQENRRRGRGGGALLSGLLRCRRCGRRVSVGYSGASGAVARYVCRTGKTSYALGSCLSFSSVDFDQRVADAMLEALQPLAVDAALTASQALVDRHAAQRQLLLDELTQREYEADLAARRYQAVDPANRLVACTLEASWEQALADVSQLRVRLEALDIDQQAGQQFDRHRLLALAEDLERIWNAPAADQELKQRIVALMIEEMIVDVEDEKREIVGVIHWRGGVHTTITCGKRRKGQSTHAAASIVELLRAASPRWTDEDLAHLLNRLGTTTGSGNPWTRPRVRSLRVSKGIAPHDPEVAARYVSMSQAAHITGASTKFIHRLMTTRELASIQICRGARVEILRTDLDRPEILEAVANRQRRRWRERSALPGQIEMGLVPETPFPDPTESKPHDFKPVAK